MIQQAESLLVNDQFRDSLYIIAHQFLSWGDRARLAQVNQYLKAYFHDNDYWRNKFAIHFPHLLINQKFIIRSRDNLYCRLAAKANWHQEFAEAAKYEYRKIAIEDLMEFPMKTTYFINNGKLIELPVKTRCCLEGSQEHRLRISLLTAVKEKDFTTVKKLMSQQIIKKTNVTYEAVSHRLVEDGREKDVVFWAVIKDNQEILNYFFHEVILPIYFPDKSFVFKDKDSIDHLEDFLGQVIMCHQHDFTFAKANINCEESYQHLSFLALINLVAIHKFNYLSQTSAMLWKSTFTELMLDVMDDLVFTAERYRNIQALEMFKFFFADYYEKQSFIPTERLINYANIIKIDNQKKENLLTLAIKDGSEEIVKLLLTIKPSININEVDEYGRTPMLQAVSSKDYDIAALLMTAKIPADQAKLDLTNVNPEFIAGMIKNIQYPLVSHIIRQLELFTQQMFTHEEAKKNFVSEFQQTELITELVEAIPLDQVADVLASDFTQADNSLVKAYEAFYQQRNVTLDPVIKNLKNICLNYQTHLAGYIDKCDTLNNKKANLAALLDNLNNGDNNLDKFFIFKSNFEKFEAIFSLKRDYEAKIFIGNVNKILANFIKNVFMKLGFFKIEGCKINQQINTVLSKASPLLTCA